MGDQVDNAIDALRQLLIKPQIYLILYVVQGNKDRPAHDLHQSSSSSGDPKKHKKADKRLLNN